MGSNALSLSGETHHTRGAPCAASSNVTSGNTSVWDCFTLGASNVVSMDNVNELVCVVACRTGRVLKGISAAACDATSMAGLGLNAPFFVTHLV